MHKASYQEVLAALRQVALGSVADRRATETALSLRLIDDGGTGLTADGRRIVEDGLRRGNSGVVEEVLRERVREHPAARALLEGGWGLDLGREQATEIMRYAHPESRAWNDGDFGRFFATLNFVKLVVYSKKTARVRIMTGAPDDTPRSEGTLISPATPYRNKRLFATLLSDAKPRLWWFDSHLDRKGLQMLYEEADFTELAEVRILTCGRSALSEAALDDYRRLKEELGGRSVSLEWRTILDREDFNEKHDRWVRSGDTWWNVPPFSAVMVGKYGSLLEDRNLPPFEEWWDSGTEVTGVTAGSGR